MSQVANLARAWVGTPYRHQAALKGVGCDCLGLVRGIHAELFGILPAAPPYSADWAEASGVEQLIEGLSRHLDPIPVHEAAGGDVLVFRLRRGLAAKHAAIVTAAGSMVHAHEGAWVAEVPMTRWWMRHAAAAFRFPITPGGA